MPPHAPPVVECDRHHTGISVSDIAAAVEYYTAKVGFRENFTWGDPPTMAGVSLGAAQIFLERGTPNPGGVNLYFVVDDADALCEYQRSNGVTIEVEPGDRDYGLRDYSIRDLHGYRLSFGHNIFTVGEPVPIERVELPIRIERRLAALLQDLAIHKRMSLSSCLEEILLHTSEPFGDGVASPHTKSTLRHIQKLKEKHGIDYDCHASYRFVELDPSSGG